MLTQLLGRFTHRERRLILFRTLLGGDSGNYEELLNTIFDSVKWLRVRMVNHVDFCRVLSSISDSAPPSTTTLSLHDVDCGNELAVSRRVREFATYVRALCRSLEDLNSNIVVKDKVYTLLVDVNRMRKRVRHVKIIVTDVLRFTIYSIAHLHYSLHKLPEHLKSKYASELRRHGRRLHCKRLIESLLDPSPSSLKAFLLSRCKTGLARGAVLCALRFANVYLRDLTE